METSSRKTRTVLGFLIGSAAIVSVVLLAPTSSFAAGGAKGYGSISDTIFPWINFVLYCVAMYLILRKPLSAGWTARRTAILQAVEAGKRANDQAREKYTAAQERARSVPTVVKELEERILQEGKVECTLLQQESEERISKIHQTTAETLAGEEKAFELDLRRQFVDSVLKIAEKEIRSEINESKDRDLRHASLRHIKALLN
jgi:F0F1-type ATP synthase membrane subunit b/b'